MLGFTCRHSDKYERYDMEFPFCSTFFMKLSVKVSHLVKKINLE